MSRKETNLKGVIAVSKGLFNLVPLKTHKDFPFLTSHPFSNSTVSMVGDKLLDLTKEEDFQLWKTHIFSLLDEETRIEFIRMMINKPYLLLWFKLIKSELSEKDYAELLRNVWTSQENPNRDINVTKKECVEMFKKANKNHLMSKEEQDTLNALDNEVVVYRGILDKSAYNGLSWTLDREKAEWFAHRYNLDEGKVLKAVVKKTDIMALFMEEGEQEVIVNIPLSQIEEID